MKRFSRILSVVLSILVVLGTLTIMPTPQTKVYAAKDVPLDEFNFPDPVFRKYIENEISTTFDGVLYASEIEACKKLNLSVRVSSEYSGIKDLKGIENFTEITELIVYGQNVSSINLSSNTKLESADIQSSHVTSVNFGSNTSLEYLYLSSNELTSLDVSKQTGLKSIAVNGNPNLTSLNLSSNTKLTTVNVNNTGIKSLDISNCTLVDELWANDCKSLSSLTGVGSNLMKFGADNTKLTSLDLSKCGQLNSVTCNNSLLTSLKLPASRGLYVVSCDNNRLNELDVSLCTSLKRLSCDGNNISELKINSVYMKGMTDTTPAVNGNTVTYTGTFLYETTEISVDKFTVVPNKDGSSAYDANAPRPSWAGSVTSTPTPTPSSSTTKPTTAPTQTPTKAPGTTTKPTAVPTQKPGSTVTTKPTAVPTQKPGSTVTTKPTTVPTQKPGSAVTTKPTAVPTQKPGSTVTTKPTSAPASKPTTAPNGGSGNESNADTGVGGFIERLYTVALGRDFDEGGKNYWTDEIKFNGKNGADIAYQFLYSDEFLGKNMSQDDFLTVLYRTFFDREPDASGLKFWKDQMSAGKTKEWVIAGFINSEEWANICLSYGIPSGSTVAPTITVVPNEQVIGFATRLYTTCLKREYDPSGLDFWAKELANLRRTGSEAAKGFFFSDEIAKSGISDSEFLTRLYTTLMNREPEKEGFNYWLNQMKTGAMSRSDVFDGFAASAEWAGICADYGILK